MTCCGAYTNPLPSMDFWHDGGVAVDLQDARTDQLDDRAAGERRVRRAGRHDGVAAETGEDLRETLLLDQPEEVGEQLAGVVGNQRVDRLDDRAAMNLAS